MARRDPKKILISKEAEKDAIAELIHWFQTERGEEIGNLEAMMALSFILEKIGPAIYNQAMLDAQVWLSEKTEEMYGLML